MKNGNGDLFMKCRNLTTILAIVSLGIMLTACKNEVKHAEKTRPELPAATVSVDTVKKQSAQNQVEVVGTVQAVEQAEISSKITGNIITLPVDLGSTVQQGDLLVELSAGEISAKVQQAKAQLAQARRNLAREENLLKKHAATPETVKSLEDITRIAEAAYKEANTMLDYTRITAPFSGIVTKKLANAGDLATPGKILLNIEEGTKLQVLTAIPEAMILKIKKGDRLPIFIPSVNLTISGVVAEVSPTADPSSRTAPIKLGIATDPKLRSGQFARVTLASEESETLVVPTSAIVPFGQMERVFIAENNRAKLRIVRTGAFYDTSVEILSGLQENETVIVAGNQTLEDGQPIVVQ
jgi:RND family efflux transporter MFP subunit